MSIRHFMMFCFACIASTAVIANNIQVSNISLTGQNATNNTVQVQFTVSWENSWRVSAGPANWDAAWVFVKFRKGYGPWQHASLGADPSHIAPAGSTINTGLVTPGTAHVITTNPGVGAFIYRSALGSGTFTVTNAQLQWNYGANGMQDNDVVDVQVYAIEMVYVPQGAFAVGDGTGLYSGFTLTTINTANALTVPTGTGSLGGQAGGHPTGHTPPTSSAWPNGFNAFYSMKYEISQQGYVDFLNSLERSQQSIRVGSIISPGTTTVTNRFVMTNSASVISRNSIRCDGTVSANGPIVFYCDLDSDGVGGEINDGKDIACNYISWGDISAYLDWTGLRPHSELEFEKSARGNLLPVAGEFAWGNSTVVLGTSLLNTGQPNEVLETGANVGSNTMGGPVRVGIHAKASSTRQDAGAGYYGILDLSGNIFERPITIGTAEGKAFTGSHGNGILNGGNVSNTDWSPSGTGIRGGQHGGDPNFAPTSARTQMQSTFFDRFVNTGGRGARTAP